MTPSPPSSTRSPTAARRAPAAPEAATGPTRAERRRLARLAGELLDRTVLANRYIPWRPTPIQAVALTTPCLEMLYGGAAGGGKSVMALMAALQYVHVPGYAALLIRKTFPDLTRPGALMDLADQWLRPTDAQWENATRTWRFPSGATVSFGYLQHEADRFNYQGAAFQFIGFDELTQHKALVYRYLFSRLRKPVGMPVPLRMRNTSNPGGIGHDWVKDRFILARSRARAFVPAKLDDNPHLDRETYLASLAELDPVTRLQLQHGDWDARPEGNLFKRHWFLYAREAPRLVNVVRFWDLAATEESAGEDPDWTAGVKMGVDAAGVFHVLDVVRLQGTPHEVERAVHRTALRDGVGVKVYMEQEPGSAGKALVDGYRRRVLRGFEFRGVPSSGDKVTRCGPLSSACEAGDVRLVPGPWLEAFLDELCAFPQVGHDDQVDAAGGAFRELTRGNASGGAAALARAIAGRGHDAGQDEEDSDE